MKKTIERRLGYGFVRLLEFGITLVLGGGIYFTYNEPHNVLGFLLFLTLFVLYLCRGKDAKDFFNEVEKEERDKKALHDFLDSLRKWQGHREVTDEDILKTINAPPSGENKTRETGLL
jgi:hypothetical protein